MIHYGFNKVVLGPVLEKVLPMLFNWRNNPELYQYFRQYRPLTMEEHVQWFRGLHRNDSVRMFVAGHGDAIIGVCGLTSIDRVNSRAELSCYVIPEHQNLEDDVINTLIRYAFDHENLNSVYAEVFETNVKKLEILDKRNPQSKVYLPHRYWRMKSFIGSHLYTFLRTL